MVSTRTRPSRHSGGEGEPLRHEPAARHATQHAGVDPRAVENGLTVGHQVVEVVLLVGVGGSGPAIVGDRAVVVGQSRLLGSA